MIQVHKKSLKYIVETFSEYHMGDERPKVLPARTIFHLYAVSDTISDESDYLSGFVDALLFNVDIYNCNAMEKYTIESRDQIELNVPARVRIFKDGSTMIIVDVDVTLGVYQSLEINRAANNPMQATFLRSASESA